MSSDEVSKRPIPPTETALQAEANQLLRDMGGQLVTSHVDQVYKWVVDHCRSEGRQTYTYEVEAAFTDVASTTLRGYLRQLVRCGQLICPMRGSYVPRRETK